ncbi:hypothetical protein J6590_091001 [Homalodisca vitripennis]|nr:hypothetical protein J6590_091001 [Homalodisca vitripennis]
MSHALTAMLDRRDTRAYGQTKPFKIRVMVLDLLDALQATRVIGHSAMQARRVQRVKALTNWNT